MRILVVTQDFPWPPYSGSFLRLDNVVRALAELGEVDLFSFVYDSRRAGCEVPADLPIRRVGITVYPVPDFSWSARARWPVTGLPLELARMDFRQNRAEFDAWRAADYDLVWVSKAGTYEALGRPNLGPTVVDLDDLEDHKILARLSWADSYGRGPLGRLHRRAAILQGRWNARFWRRLQNEIAAAAPAVVVCSDVDQERLGSHSAAVVGNGYDVQSDPVGRLDVRQPPTILLQGVLHYPPNSDAAQWLVREILPLVRREIPDVRIRLVGDSHPVVDALHDPPAVTVVGEVDDMRVELAGADVVAVPIRYGSGTRVKILEAFAHRIPVVSTTLGAEGLRVESGRHLVLADDAAAFAEGLVNVLRQRELRVRLTEAAQSRFLESYQRAASRDAVRALARKVAQTRVSDALA